MRAGMDLSANGRWEEKQLFPKLQSVARKRRRCFNGEPVIESESSALESPDESAGGSDSY